MTQRANLRLVDQDTGEVVESDGCSRCQEVQIGDVENLQRENTRLLRRMNKLQEDQDAKRLADPNRALILSIIKRWAKATGHPNANVEAADRFDLVKARLREKYTVAQLELAVDGLGAFPYVVNGNRVPEGKPNQRHDRLGIALGGGEAVERFANLGAMARRK